MIEVVLKELIIHMKKILVGSKKACNLLICKLLSSWILEEVSGIGTDPSVRYDNLKSWDFPEIWTRVGNTTIIV